MTWDFQIVQVTAAGTFGTVCVAFDWNSRGFFALKVLKERFITDPRVLARTVDEATILTMLNHPNILQVHDMLQVGDRPVVVMEWVQGCSLQDLVDCLQKGLPASCALEIVRQACDALDAAYNTLAPQTGKPMHIIHRDLKPSNILLSLAGTTKVVDFGIARGIFEGRHSETVSMVLGSRAYMAPERLDGQADTPRLDVYAMGLILYELLHGDRESFSLRPHVHAHQREVAFSKLQLQDCENPAAAAAIRALLTDMTAYEYEDRPYSHEVVARILEIQAALPPPDMQGLANHDVRPIFDANSLMDPRAHEDYPELAFIDAIGPTAPGGDPRIDQTLRAFLDEDNWPGRVEELWTLLLLNPSWTSRPFVDWLDGRRAQWWQFWQQNQATVPQKIALLRILACRMDDKVLRRVKRFKVDPDPRVRRLAGQLITAHEVTAF